MDTTAAQLRFVDLEFSESVDDLGRKRIFAQNATAKIEIYPSQSVAMFLHSITRDVWDVVGLYLGDDQKVSDLLMRASQFCRDNPNTPFQGMLSETIHFEMTQIRVDDTSVISLRIHGD